MRYIIIDDNMEELERTDYLMSLIDGTQLCLKTGNRYGLAQEIIALNPQILFIEIELGFKDGFQLFDELMLLQFKGKVVVTTRYEYYSIKAIKAGFFDFLLKPVHIEELKATIDRVRALNHELRHEKQCFDKLKLLSKREMDILLHLKMGKTSKQISEELGITKNTVDTHRRKILEKTGFGNTNELIRKVEF